MRLDQIDGRLIERSADRHEPRVADLTAESHELFGSQPRVLEPFDVVKLLGAPVIRVDERLEMSVLKLECKAIWKFAQGITKLTNDPNPVVEAAHVVVRHLSTKSGVTSCSLTTSLPSHLASSVGSIVDQAVRSIYRLLVLATSGPMRIGGSCGMRRLGPGNRGPDAVSEGHGGLEAELIPRS